MTFYLNLHFLIPYYIIQRMNKIHYCPIGQIQRQFGVYVTGAGKETTNPGEPYPHAYHSSDYYFTWKKGRALADWEYQLLYIRTGKGEIEFQREQRIPIEGGTIIILHPGEWHRYRPDPETGWSEAYIGIGGEFLSRFFSQPFFSKPPTIIHQPPNGIFDKELVALVDEIQSTSAERPYSLALKTLQLLTTLFEAPFNRKGKESHNIDIRRANLHIAHHLGEIVDFEKLASSLGMSYTSFRKCFQKYNGMAPLEYQIALRIRRATHLLKNSDAPVAQIAKETGFQSHAYFSRFFRAHTGISPVKFRLLSSQKPS